MGNLQICPHCANTISFSLDVLESVNAREKLEESPALGPDDQQTYVLYLISGAKGKQANVLSADLSLEIFAL